MRLTSLWRPLLAGLGVRLALAGLVNYAPPDLTGDAGDYQLMAHNLLYQGTFSLQPEPPFTPTLFRAPFYPLFIAAHYALFGLHTVPILGTQALLGLATGVMLYLAIRAFSPRAAPAALWAYMLCPLDAIYYGRVLSEELSTFLLTAALAPIVCSRTSRAHLVGGMALGAACLTRDVYSPLILLIPAALVWLFRQNWRQAGLYALAAGLVICPWTVRNALSVGQPVLISKGILGQNLWIGTWERDDAWRTLALGYPDYAFQNEEQRQLVARLVATPTTIPEQIQMDAAFAALARQRMLTDPGSVLRAWIVRYPRLWFGTRTDLVRLRLERHSLPWKIFKGLAFGCNALVIVLGTLGAGLVWRRRQTGLLLTVPILYTALVFIPLHNVETRYTQPIFPLLLGLAVYAVLEGRR